MKISQSGIDLIKRFEGLRLEAYPDPGSGGEPWTIGYGTTHTSLGPVRPGMRITESEAEQLLLSDIRYFEQKVNDLVKVPLTQNQFDALCSFAYNCGEGALASSTLLEELNAGNYQEAADQFSRWTHASGNVMPGLVTRRNAERNLFMQAGGTTPPAATSPSSPGSTPPAPTVKEQVMALPAIVAAAASSLLPLVIDLFKARGSKTSTRNAEVIEAAAPVLVGIAKELVPGANEQAVAETILADKALQDQFRAAVALKWSDIEPFMQFDAQERKDAREFARVWDGDRLILGQFRFIELLSLILVIISAAGGYMVLSGSYPAEMKGAVITLILIAGFNGVKEFWLGSSASGRQSGQTISEIAKGK